MDDIRISLDTTGAANDISVVRVDGVVDTMTASELERVMNTLIDQKRFRIIIDLAGVDYISSAGWGIFISNIREIKANAGDIKLARMIPSVYEIFELLEFDSILKAYDNIEKAKLEFRGGGDSIDPVSDARAHNQKEVASASVARQVEVATAEMDVPKVQPTVRKAVEEPVVEVPTGERNVEKTVLSLIKADPFYTIREITQMVNSESNGSGTSIGWWGVWSILRKHSLLSRKKRFRYSRKA